MAKDLEARQHKAIRLLVDGEENKSQVAKSVKVSRQTLYNWMDDADFMAEYFKELRKNIQSLVPKAIITQKELLESANDQVRYLVSRDILDRAEKYGLFTPSEDSGELNKLIKGLADNG